MDDVRSSVQAVFALAEICNIRHMKDPPANNLPSKTVPHVCKSTGRNPLPETDPVPTYQFEIRETAAQNQGPWPTSRRHPSLWYAWEWRAPARLHSCRGSIAISTSNIRPIHQPPLHHMQSTWTPRSDLCRSIRTSIFETRSTTKKS